MQDFLSFLALCMFPPQHLFKGFPCRSRILGLIYVFKFYSGLSSCSHVEDITQLRPCSTLPAVASVPNKTVDVCPYSSMLLQKGQMLLILKLSLTGLPAILLHGLVGWDPSIRASVLLVVLSVFG